MRSIRMRWDSAALLLAALALLCGAASCGSSGGGQSAGSASPSPSNVVLSSPIEHLDVGDLSIAYRVIGPLDVERDDAQGPLLMIMGFSGVMDLWSPGFVESLAQDREVVLFDNRGIGGTNGGSGSYPFSQLADDTAAFIVALGYERLDVLGWSMGGDVAVDLAVRHPERVRQLIVYAGDAGGDRAIPPDKAAMATLTDTSGTPEERGRRLLGLLFPEEWAESHPDNVRSFPVPREQAAPAAVKLQEEAMGSWRGVWDELAGISAPTLLVTGTEDVLTPPQNSTMMAASIPGSWLARFEGAGHGLMYQYPLRLADTVLVFLSATARELT